VLTPTLRESFVSPSASYRPAPFLVLNDDHGGEAENARMTQILEGYRRVGYGGAFLHPRPGLITPYLSPRWFEVIRHAIAECRRLGLVPYLYDENSYPSGVGGGHVPARAPEARTQYVTPVFGVDPGAIPTACLTLYRWEGDRPGPPIEPAEVQPGQPWVAFVLRSMQPTAWHGETACPSILDPRAVGAFIETTYAAYRHELGDLWPDIPAIFTDEPHLPADSHGPWSPGLHLTPYVLGQFQQQRGYDPRRHLASVYYDVGDYRRIRFDLYDLMHELWVENWALPLEAWCKQHTIALTGHYLEHDWPCPYATPGHVHMLAHMQWPGTDMLETFLLTGHDFYDIQNLHPTSDGKEPQALVSLRQCHSVANQLGKERVVDESWGAGGHDSTPADWARIGRWLIVHGVNLLIPHLSFTTIRGTRKTDHPQTFSDHSPWYEYLRPLNDELARLCWTSNQGRVDQRILVLDPLTTGFCVSRKADCLPHDSAAAHSASAPPEASQYHRALSSVLDLQHNMGALVQALSDAQADFDLGDEYVLDEFGRVDNRVIGVGQQAYGLIVWPGCLANLRRKTAEMLDAYLTSGGLLYGIDPGEVTVDGRPSDARERLGSRCRWFPDREALVGAVLAAVPPRLQFDDPPATGLAHMRRVVDGSEIFLVVNSSAETVASAFSVETGRASLYELDPASGDCYRVGATREGRFLRARLELQPRTATVLWATEDDVPTGERPSPTHIGDTVAPLELARVTRTLPNVLVVDVCQLELNGIVHEPELVYAANKRLWMAHGLETNGWMATIQYRDQILDRNRTMRPDSGGAVSYRFEVSPRLDPAGIQLGIETPHLWRISVNGHAVDTSRGVRWLDDHIRLFAIGACVRPGENVVVLDGRPFDVRREIDQIYLLGDFACHEATPGFRLGPSRPLSLGPWCRQGCPFYDREVAYAFDLPATAQRGEVVLHQDDWAGSVLLVEYDGRVIAQLQEPPYRVQLERGRADTVTVRVVGLPKNLLGPWHDPGRPRKRAWIPMWYGPNIPIGPQPGERYDLLDLGLFAAPRWESAP